MILPPNVYFWRDKLGNEIDALLEEGRQLIPIEIKSSATLQSEMFDGLIKWCHLADMDPASGTLIYAGEEKQIRKQGNAVPWNLL